jgi:hypothetical protein
MRQSSERGWQLCWEVQVKVGHHRYTQLQQHQVLHPGWGRGSN